MGKPAQTLEHIVRTLEDDVLFGRLRTRERLIEDELIERFGATRHVVRQALAELERLGMIVRHRHRGAVVRDFSRDEVEQISTVRELLHAQAAALVPLPPPAPLVKRLSELCEAHAREVESGNLRGIHQANNAFHEAFFEACGNPYLARTIREYAQMSLAFRCHVMVNPFLARRARDEHRAMLAALRKGDRAKLVRLCVQHTGASKQVYLAMQGVPAGDPRIVPADAAQATAAAARKRRRQREPAARR